MKKIYCIALICIFNLNFQGMEDMKIEDVFSNKELFEKLIGIQKQEEPKVIQQKPKWEKFDDNCFQIKEKPNLGNKKYNNEEENNKDQNFINNLNNLRNQNFEDNKMGEVEEQVPMFGDQIQLGCCCLVHSSKINEANNKIINGNNNIDDANRKIRQLNDKNNQLVNEYNTLFQNRRDILNAFGNEITRLKQTRNEALIKIFNLNQNVDNQNGYIEQLKKQINLCGKEYEKLKNYDEKLDKYIETQNKNYKELLEYYKHAKDVAKESEVYLNKLEENERKNCRNIDSLKTQNTNLDEKIKMLNQNLTSKEKDIDVLNKKLESSNEKNTSLNKDLSNIKIDFEKVKNEKQTLNDLNIKHENEIKSFNQKIEEKEKQIKILEEQNKELKKNIQELETSKKVCEVKKENIVKGKDKDIENLKSKIKELNENINDHKSQKKLDDETYKNNIEKINIEKNNLENNFKEQIKELEKKINDLKINENVLKVEKENIKNEKTRLEEDTISKDKEIENLRKENKLLQEKNLELNNTYNKNIKEINEKNSKFLNLYLEEVEKNNNRNNVLFQAITKLNLDWNTSFNTFNDDNKKNIENIINLNENSNEKKREEFNTTINNFIEGQKKMIEEINKSNNEKLGTIFNYYKETLMDFENKYKNTLEKFEKQANNYENAVGQLKTTLEANSANNSADIVQSVFNLTSNINDNFKKTCEELNNQKEQFSKNILNLGNNINGVIDENVNKINNNMNSLNENTINDIKSNIGVLNQNNIEELNKTTETFKDEFKKTNEEYIKSNDGIKNSLNTLTEKIDQWSKEKNSLEERIKKLEEENKSLNKKNSNLNSELSKKEQEYSLLNKEKEKLNSNYNDLQEEIRKIGEELKIENGNENEEDLAKFGFQILKIKDKIKELQENSKNDKVNYINLKKKNKQLNKENSKLNKEKYDAIMGKLEAEKQSLNKGIELLTRQTLDNNIKNKNVKNENEINKKIEELKKDIDEKFEDAKQAVSLDNKNKELEKKIVEQEEQLKATALGFDLKEQQEFDNYANKMRQENIRTILNNATIGDEMKDNGDNKNENEILKEEYYLPFIFENYNINNKWICLNKFVVSLCKGTQDLENKENIALENKEIVYYENLIYKSFDDVLFENLEKSKEFNKINLGDIASKKIKIKKQSQNEKKEEKKEEEFDVKDVDEKKLESYEKYKIYIRRKEEKILLGNYFCEAAVNILKNFPDADLYLLFIGNTCYFYLKEIPLQKFMEYCAFVQGCSLASRVGFYGEYLSMYINDIVTGSAAIERNNFKYFTKEDLQSIFSSLFSNRWFKCKDITQPKQDGDFIPKEILSYPELLIKPLNKNEYTASKIIEKELQHPYVEKKIKTKVRIYDKKTVFWYKCDMQDPVTYLLSECIGLGNYGYIGRFYKRDGQGNYYPVALKLTLDSETHQGGSHEAIMKEIKAGKAAAVMGCNRMIYSNKAGLIKLNNSNFIDEIGQKDFSNRFLAPLQFIKEEKQMKNNNEGYKKLLLAKQKFGEFSDIFFRNDQKMDTERWDKDKLKKVVDYDYRIKFLEERFKNFYNSENFKKFQNLMFNKDNTVQNPLLYVMEMDIIEEKDEDLYTETTTEKTKNNEENEIKEEKIKQDNEINEEDKEIDINDNIKNTINNIAEYLTAQNKCGVIHGDIKAKNMTKNKFLDFGSFDIVTNYETNTDFSDVVGTPEYWDLVRIFNKQLELVAPYDALLKDYQLSDLYASIVALYYYMFKEYPAFATLIIIIKSILKHYINDVDNNKNYCNYEKKIEDFIDSFPIGKKLVECTKAFEKDKNLKKQINKDMNDDNLLKEEEKEKLDKFNKYLKEVEDKNYLIGEVKQLRYCIYQIIQYSLLTVDDVKKRDEEVDQNKLFFIMSKDINFYSKGEDRWIEVKEFTKDVVEKLIKIYEDLREKELENIGKLINSKNEKNKMLGRIMYQILQQGTFANSDKYPAFEVYKNEHSYNNKTEGNENYRREDLGYRKIKSELINKIRNNEKNIENFLNDNEDFKNDYEERLFLQKNSYLYTLEPLSIKSLITQQPYYQYKKSFIDTINEGKNENEEKK